MLITYVWTLILCPLPTKRMEVPVIMKLICIKVDQGSNSGVTKDVLACLDLSDEAVLASRRRLASDKQTGYQLQPINA